jgi:hypothetical protein
MMPYFILYLNQTINILDVDYSTIKRLNDSIEENAAKLLKIRAKMRSLIIIKGVFICCFNMMLNNIF